MKKKVFHSMDDIEHYYFPKSFKKKQEEKWIQEILNRVKPKTSWIGKG